MLNAACRVQLPRGASTAMAATASARPAGFHPLEAMVNDMSRDFTLFSSRLREETATLGTRLRSAPLPATTADGACGAWHPRCPPPAYK